MKNSALERDIFFWLGKDSSQDEMGACAYKTVELDTCVGPFFVRSQAPLPAPPRSRCAVLLFRPPALLCAETHAHA
jgi:hypothetical protein